MQPQTPGQMDSTDQASALAGDVATNRPAHLAGAPPLKPDDWVWLNPNDRVRIKRENEYVVLGTVDDVSPDASIFWIWLDGGQGRVAIHEDDNTSVWFVEERPWLYRTVSSPTAKSVQTARRPMTLKKASPALSPGRPHPA